MKQVPLQSFHPQRTIVRNLFLGLDFPKGIRRPEHDLQQRNTNDIIHRVVRERAGVSVIDPAPAFFDTDGHSRLAVHLGPYYRDDYHVSDLGVNELLRPLF